MSSSVRQLTAKVSAAIENMRAAEAESVVETEIVEISPRKVLIVQDTEQFDAKRRAVPGAIKTLENEDEDNDLGAVSPERDLSPPRGKQKGGAGVRHGQSETVVKSYTLYPHVASALASFAKANGVSASFALSELLTDCPQLRPFLPPKQG